MTLPQLTITIQQIDAEARRYLAIVKRDNDAEVCRHPFTFEPDKLVNMEPQWMLEKAVPRTAVDTPRSTDTGTQLAQKLAELATYGQRLHRYLFGDGTDFNAFLRYNDRYRQPCRLTLAMHENAAALWRLPWEYLHDGDEFLALSGRFLLNRRPDGMATLERDPIKLPLRILMVVSSPDNQLLLDTEEEIGVVQEALDEAYRAGLVDVRYLEDATLPYLGDELRDFNPHVLHYTGHGAFDKKQGRSVLVLENDDGQSREAGIAELKPYLQHAPALRLVLLSGCQTAQTSDVDAFSGVATGMLAENIAAVVAMQFSILDSSAIALARAFYRALARGDTLTGAMHATRLALRDFDDGPGYDWGIPALYLRTPTLTLVDPAGQDVTKLAARSSSPAALVSIEGLPLPRHFVGRKAELRQMRRAVRDARLKSVYVRGIGGMGKSSVAAKLIDRPGSPLSGVCVIRCHEVDPLDIPTRLASFLQGQGQAGHAAAGSALLDSRLSARERVDVMVDQIGSQRYLFVFDNFESLLDRSRTDAAAYPVADAALGNLLAALAQANWRSLCLFTGRFRWEAMDELVGPGLALEIDLPELTPRQAIMMMDNLPRLRQQPIRDKIKIVKKVGGHPKSIELLNGWLAQNTLDELFAQDRLAQAWERYFLRDLLAQLTPAEQEQLGRLAIFQGELDDDLLAYAAIADATRARWLDLSLLQAETTGGAPMPAQLAAMLELFPTAEQDKIRAQYAPQQRVSVHPVVADYLLGQMPPAARRDLHKWAAAFYGRPFVEMARQAFAQAGAEATEPQIEQEARNGAVEFAVRRTDDMAQARGAMARALEWQRHLFAAGEVEAAAEIVTAVYDILARWGERDHAKGLLRRSIASLEGGNKAVAQGNLATLLSDEGKLAEALATYEAVYATFAELDAKQQMAAVLGQMGTVLQDMGKLDEAIEKHKESLKIKEEIGNEEGQAISLHQLSILYDMQGNYAEALARSEAAEALARKLKHEQFLAAMLHQQGMTYNAMARTAESDAQQREYGATAVERFQSSLAIKRRIRDDAGTADTLGELGKLLRDAGQMTDAINAFNEARSIYRRTNNPAKAAISIEHLGIVHEIQGEYPAALAKYQEALALLKQYGSPQYVAIVENDIARVQAKLRGTP